MSKLAKYVLQPKELGIKDPENLLTELLSILGHYTIPNNAVKRRGCLSSLSKFHDTQVVQYEPSFFFVLSILR